MCRLFAVCAARPVKVDRAFAALQQLSHEHHDGWGLARFDDRHPLIERSVEPAHASARFGHLKDDITTRHLLAHIRLASVGGVTERNAHPFVGGRWAFMHNGTVHRFEKNAQRIDELIAPHWQKAIRGQTDSERCCGLFLTALDQLEQPGVADVARVIAGVMHTVSTLCDHESDAKPSALNFLVSDGQRLFATRRGRTLYRAEDGEHRYIASERLWEGPAWVEVPEESVIAFDEEFTYHQWTVGSLLTR